MGIAKISLVDGGWKCLFRHKWGDPTIDGPYEYSPGFAMMYGNALAERQCRRCGKKHTVAVYIRERSK